MSAAIVNRIGRNAYGTGGRYSHGDIVRVGCNRQRTRDVIDEGSGRSIWTLGNSADFLASYNDSPNSKEGIGFFKPTGGANSLSTPYGQNNCLASGGAFVGCWIYMATGLVSRDVMGVNIDDGTAANCIWRFATNAGSNPVLVVSNGTTRSVLTGSGLSANTWRYWSIDWNGTTVSLGMNGVSVATVAMSGSFNFVSGRTLSMSSTGLGTAVTTGSAWDMLQIARQSRYGTATFTPPTRFAP